MSVCLCVCVSVLSVLSVLSVCLRVCVSVYEMGLYRFGGDLPAVEQDASVWFHGHCVDERG